MQDARDLRSKRSKRTVRQILYPKDIQSKALEYGIQNERVALEELEAQIGLKTRKSGLYVSMEHPFLAFSPDGVIDGSRIVAVKCPFSARSMDPVEAASTLPRFCSRSVKAPCDFHIPIITSTRFKGNSK